MNTQQIFNVRLNLAAPLMPTVPFAGTLVRYPMPMHFNVEERHALIELADAITQECLLNPKWEGETYFDVELSRPSSFKDVKAALRSMCEQEGVSVTYEELGGHFYRFGVVENGRKPAEQELVAQAA